MTMSHDVIETSPGKKSRNLSEKKRRDQFNLLIGELSGMVASNTRKMDKSTVLKATIAFLKNQKEISVRCQNQEVREDWKPSFLSNEEFTHLMLEALDGFIMTVSCSGRVLYTSESITPLLGHLPSNLCGLPMYDLLLEEERGDMKRFLSNPALAPNPTTWFQDTKEKYTVAIHLKRGSVHTSESSHYERVHLTGYFERYNCPSEDGVLDFSCSEAEDSVSLSSCSRSCGGGLFQSSLIHPQMTQETTKLVFVAIARMERPQLVREMMIIEPAKTEFTSRHSLEWKFLFLDHRAPTIIGYMPFEVLGTSGYDYYHVDDLDKIAACHEQLMKTGKGTSCYYRFLTKGQQWIWLQTQYYITYHQWNSKPEFIVCTNTVVSGIKKMSCDITARWSPMLLTSRSVRTGFKPGSVDCAPRTNPTVLPGSFGSTYVLVKLLSHWQPPCKIEGSYLFDTGFCSHQHWSYNDVKAELSQEEIADECQSEVESHQPEGSIVFDNIGGSGAGPSGLSVMVEDLVQQLPDKKPVIQPSRTSPAGPSHLQAQHLQQLPQQMQQTQQHTEQQTQQQQQHSIQQQQQLPQQQTIQQQQQQQLQLQEQQLQQQEEHQNQQQLHQQQQQQQQQLPPHKQPQSQNLYLHHCITVQSQSSQLPPPLSQPPSASHSPNTTTTQQVRQQQQPPPPPPQQIVGLPEGAVVEMQDTETVAQQSMAAVSPSSQHSVYLSPQTPQHLTSRGEPPPWPSKARSDDGTTETTPFVKLKVPAKSWGHFSRTSPRKESSQYNGGSSLNEGGSSSKRARLQDVMHQQQQDQPPSQLILDDVAPPPSPCSDASLNSHVSLGSIHKESNLHFGSKSANKERYYRKIEFPPELSRSISSSRLSGSCEEEKKEDQFLHMMVMSPSGSASSHTSGGGFGMEPQYIGSIGSSGGGTHTMTVTGGGGAAVGNTATQVVQVAAVPFSPVIPLNPVVTNLSVQLPAVPTTEGLRQSLILSPDQRQLQDQLRRKHAELQQQILRQQEELRQVNDQLIMAQYGSLSLQHVYKGGLQYTTTSSVGTTGGFHSSIAVGPSVGGVLGMGTAGIPVSASLHPVTGAVSLATGTLAAATSSIVQPVAMTSPASLQSPTITVSTLNPAQVSVESVSTQGLAVPYQLSNQHAQMLFAQPGGTGQAHSQSQQHQSKK
ncbi:neuronal PAS domain-containing protein 2 isoform X2 [Procambarus clarkii]|uniref:neuronal PAS domain-containing protein 2 isoform X2 n=1 Tax=Procambarus clarkii TaxID=6728 RepID=UPI00374494CD